uniref:Uncharacterized protein n=1 Tax=Rhizophora mucronata TaxID=61149 RepID=A0A2P2IHZ7_RHIMU
MVKMLTPLPQQKVCLIEPSATNFTKVYLIWSLLPWNAIGPQCKTNRNINNFLT